jgi:proton glutamate symport protein
MRGQHSSPTARVAAALVAGLALGIVISASGNSALQSIATATEIVGIVWINAIRMTVIPLVVSLLFVSMTGFSDIRSAGQLGGLALIIFAVFLGGTAVFAVLTVPVLFSWMPMEATTAAALN